MQLVIGLICSGSFLAIIAVRQVYYCVPLKELKRLARNGDSAGDKLYKVAAFGDSLNLFSWILAGILAAISFAMFITFLNGFLAIFIVASLLWLGFGLLQSSPPRAVTVRLASWISPYLAGLLARIQPVLEPVNRFLQNHRRIFDHTGLYEKQDLAELIRKQQTQADSRILPEEVELLQRALEFGERTAAEIILPKNQIRLVEAHETIGPKLLDELHKTSQKQFLVFEKSQPDASGHERTENKIIGFVRLDELVEAKQGGRVGSFANSGVAFVRDDFSLLQVLQAFRQTSQRLLIVINNFEEFIGIIMFENLLDALLGKAQLENLSYTDRQAIANYQVVKFQEEVKTAIKSADLPDEMVQVQSEKMVDPVN